MSFTKKKNIIQASAALGLGVAFLIICEKPGYGDETLAHSARHPVQQVTDYGDVPSSVKRFHLLFTSDIYGRYGWPGCASQEDRHADLSSMVTALNQVRESIKILREAPPLVLAGGSMIRPDILGNYVFKKTQTLAPKAASLFRQLGFQAISLGPYDFGASPRVLKTYMRLMKQTGISLLASNVSCQDKNDFRCRLKGGEEHGAMIFQRDHLRIGVLSINREDLPRRIIKRPGVPPLKVEEPVEAARRMIRYLRHKENVNLVIVLANLNLEVQTPEPVVSFVRHLGDDAPEIVVADTMFYPESQDYIERIQTKHGTLILGTDRFGQHLGHVILQYRQVGQVAIIKKVDLKVIDISSFPPQPRAKATVNSLMRQLCRAVDRPLGKAYFPSPMGEMEFTQYMLEIMRHRVKAEIALINRSCLADTSFPMEGVLTREKALRAIRSESQLGTFTMTGARIKQVLAPFMGEKIKRLMWLGVSVENDEWTVNKRPLIDRQHYKIATTRFVAEGGDGLITLDTERFKDSGSTLRQSLVRYFTQAKDGKTPADSAIRLKRDFSDLWKKWVLYWDSGLNLSLSKLAVDNGLDGNRYSQPLLKRDNVTSFKVDLKLSIGASNRNHAMEGDVALQYGRTWTLTAAEKAEGKSSTSNETADRIRSDFLYRLNWIQNMAGPGYWYIPAPYAEATLITEFTSSGECSVDSDCYRNGESLSYRYMDLHGTIGAGFLFLPSLLVKTGFAVRGELLTPQRALPSDEKLAKTGLFIGYNLRRFDLFSLLNNPIQLESRLDFFAMDLMKSSRLAELTLQSKLYFNIISALYLTVNHSLYVYDKKNIEASLANDIALGIELYLDNRYQMF